MTAWRFPADGSVVDIDHLDVRGRTGIIGPNGAGKTTLLRLMAGVTGPARLGAVSYLPQRPYLFRGSVAKNLGLGLDSEEANHALQLLVRLGGDRGWLDRPAVELSGGERQRVLLARTLARRSDVVLLDEPLSMIAAADRAHLVAVVGEALGNRRSVVVSHDREELVILADTLVVMLDGRVRQIGPIAEVLAGPVDLEVGRLIGVFNVAAGLVRRVESGLLEVAVEGVRVFGMGDVGLGEKCRIMFPAEAVTVFPGEGFDSGSARNRWPGTVESIHTGGRLVELVADVGFKVIALLTAGSAEALDLAEGQSVSLGVKAAAVSVVRQ